MQASTKLTCDAVLSIRLRVTRRAIIVFTCIAAGTCVHPAAVVAQNPEVCSLSEPDDRLPPEGYGDGGNLHSYLQLPGSEYGLRQGQQPFQERATPPEAVPLCLERYAVVWATAPPTNVAFPKAMGLIVGKDLQPIRAFDISTGDAWYQPHITRLDAAHFLVLWQTIRGTLGSERRLTFGRVFNYEGVATTEEFPISLTRDNLNDAHARVLSNGRIIVTWYRFRDGVYIRLFDPTGQPATEETLVASFSEFDREPLTTTTAVSTDGFIVFVRESPYLDTKPPFSYSRTYSSNGVPLGPLVRGDSVQQQAEHQQAVEIIAAVAASHLEFDLRQVNRRTTGDPWFGNLCRPLGAANISNAIGVAKYSENVRIRGMAVTYCKAWGSTCGLYEYRKDEHHECSNGGN